MAVFDNLRNFIRQGKQAATNTSGSTTPGEELSVSRSAVDSPGERQTTQKSGSSAKSENGHASTQLEPARSAPSTKVGTYSTAAKKIVEEESRARNRMPQYPGLEQYHLLEKMGDGAFSVVYKALDQTTNECRAIKVVSKKRLTHSQRAAVLKEAAIMRQLDHENIVKMYAFLESEEHYFIVLELVAGGELFHQIVRLTYFSEDLSRHVIVQVAHAIRHLHEVAGVVHRDIKPENLLYSPIDFVPSKQRVLRAGDDSSKEDEGEFIPGKGAGGIGVVKLADFGLSKIIWDNKTMTPCGTVGYTAPEIVKDERYSKSVDMWALGCVLYTVLCGFPPFYDESIEVLTHKVAKGQYTFLSPWWDDISTSAKDLVSKLLTVDPEKRLTIDEFLQHPWITQDGTVPVIESSEVSSRAAQAVDDRRKRDAAIKGALKDAFDVSNAVYRMEEEAAKRTAHVPSILEEEEEDAEVELIEELVADVRDVSVSKSQSRTRKSRRDQEKERERERERERDSARAARAVNQPEFFDLHLEGATLLERRRRQSKEPGLVA